MIDQLSLPVSDVADGHSLEVLCHVPAESVVSQKPR